MNFDKKITFIFATPGLVILVSLFLAEIFLRAMPGPWNHPRNWTIEPILGPWSKRDYVDSFKTKEFYVSAIHWNEFGMRDRSRVVEKKSGVFRIGILGDSMMEGLQVADKLTTSSQLEGLLNRKESYFEALNFGKSSIGTVSEYLIYLYKAKRFNLDVVILFFMPDTDVWNNSRTLSSMVRNNSTGGPYPFIDRNSSTNSFEFSLPKGEPEGYSFRNFLRENFRIYRFWRYVRDKPLSVLRHENDEIKERYTPIREGVFRRPQSHDWQEAWKMTFEILNLLTLAVSRDRAIFILVLLPPASEHLELAKGLSPALDLDYAYPSEILASYAKERGIFYYDLRRPFMEMMQQQGLSSRDVYYNEDGHWKPAGHRICAVLIKDFLIKNVLIHHQSHKKGQTGTSL